MKLTKKQVAALIHIQTDQIAYRRFGHGAWRIDGPSHPTVVGKVISLGLAHWVDFNADTRLAQLTEAGRKALNS